jgi:hypothetical protein
VDPETPSSPNVDTDRLTAAADALARETDAPTDTPPAPPAAPRQRWRLIVGRAADAPPLSGRDLSEAWDTALDGSGLPIHRPTGRPRSRAAFGAPLPADIAAERELVDLVLTDLVPVWVVRDCLVAHLPTGWRLVDLHDVWLGAPPLAGQVAAADYRIDLGAADRSVVASAAADLLAAGGLPRERARGAATIQYDLRPLLIDVRVGDPGPPLLLHARTRFHPELGTGRPEEVVAALGGAAGKTFEVRSIVRERLILAEELD